MQQLAEQLSILHNAQPVVMTDTSTIPATIKTIAIVRPQDSIPVSHLAQLDAFLERGGRLAIAMNRVKGDLQSASGAAIQTGLEAWLQQKGLTVEDDFVIDAKCGSLTVQQQQGFFTIQSQIQFPYIPVAGKFADHPIATGLENVVFEFVSSIKYVGDTTKRFTPLVFSSEQSNALKAPQYFNVEKQWTEADFTQQNLVLAAALEGKVAGSGVSKLVVIADGDLVVNGGGQQPRRQQADNINLFSNAIDWLSDDTGLIALRTKGVTSRPLDQLDDSTKAIVKYGNFLLPMLLVIGYGVVRFQQNRMKRLKRMSENYEEA
jgi:ABC-type uncharacterized transport system involved in gliding motility auxiliary subunit